MADLRPRRIVHLDLASGLPAGALEGPALLVVWWRDVVLGYEHLHADVTGPQLAADVARIAAPAVAQRLVGMPADTDPPPGPEPPDLAALPRMGPLLSRLDAELARAPERRRSVTVAICTRDRPLRLTRCLEAVAAAEPAPTEILVIDNGRRHDATREIVERFPAARCVVEARPGLSAARNAAIREARGDVLAFVDDDVIVHPRWLAPLCRALDDDEVMAVTGLVLPAELETEAQVAFETLRGGFALGARGRRFDRRFLRQTVAKGMPVWKIGAGANMALRRDAFDLVGDFDERLGAGAAGCSEDSELWYRLIAEGFACRYEPDSIVFHVHRREAEALARQVHDYTQGHLAALFVQFARFRHPGNLRRALLALPKWFLRRTVSEGARAVAERAGLAPRRPVTLFRPELSGYLRGLAYAGIAVTPVPHRHKAPLRTFLAANPFPRPYTLGFFYREKMRAIHRIAPDFPVGDVLEVGGGRSGLARQLYPDAYVTTVDIEEEHGASEVNQDPRVRFVVADATALPFADESFDVVTFFDVLEHIPDDVAAAREALRVLRPGGFVLVTTPSQHWRFPYYRALAPICPSDEDMIAEWGHVRRGYAPPDLARLFGRPPVKTAGFITPLTALGHDFAWSKLPERTRRLACGVLSPLTWLAYGLQSASRPGTEIAASWRKPAR